MLAASILNQPFFHDEAAANAKLEGIVWPNGPVCPKCGSTDRVRPLAGKAHRIGLKKCYACRKQFTVKVGTVFESSHVALHLWLQAAYLLCSSKKGISSNQLARTLGVTLKTAWFMGHRLREAMRPGGTLPPLGGEGAIVEADETLIGRKPGREKRRGYQHKHVVLSLVERGGDMRSFHVVGTAARDVLPIVRQNVARESRVMTDETGQYVGLGKEFAGHEVVRHGKEEYVVGGAHTNTLEGYYSTFKRGMKGIYQRCGERHLHRYVAEFDFRYDNRVARGLNDQNRTNKALYGAVGKRLTYRDSSAARPVVA